MSKQPRHHGLFVGLATLDLIYLAERPLAANEKQVAQDYQISPGGPATNAAVTFAQMGRLATGAGEPAPSHRATLWAVIGQHPLAALIRADAQRWGVELLDLAPGYLAPPSLSSVVVDRASGERAVISINAQRSPVAEVERDRLSHALKSIDILLIDGHQMALAIALAPLAQQRKIPVVVDGGSWKPGFEQVLAATDYAICAASFRPPGCSSEAEACHYLQGLGVPHIAFTHGGEPITYWRSKGWPPRDDRPGREAGREAILYEPGQIHLPPPKRPILDTLGAGDIFHGAFCHFILQGGFPQALQAAAAIATQACGFLGSRTWLEIK